MSYKLERTAYSYAHGLTTKDVVTSPMRKGVAIGGPKDKIKLEAPMTWDGKIQDGARKPSGFHVGHYIWTGEAWRWVVDSTDRVLVKDA